MSIPMHPERRVLVEGKPVLPADLAVGQVLTFYVQVTEPVAVVLPADEAPIEALPSAAPEAASELAATAELAAAPEMPATASPLPLIGLTGLLLLALGGGLGYARRAGR
jgi:hypothetical protein